MDDADEWAGEYGANGGEVGFTVMRWAPQAGFVLVDVYTCLPSVRRLNYGGVVAKPHWVEMTPAVAMHAPWTRGAATRFLRVTWGEWLYLVPEEKIGDFCDYVAGLGRFNGDDMYDAEGLYFVKRGEHPDPADEVPVVPPGYERFVKRPVDATVVAVGRPRARKGSDPEWRELLIPVTIDAGRLDGVAEDMNFYAIDDERGATVAVTQVGPHTSQGVVVRYAPKSPKPEDGPGYEPVEVGWRLSTSAHKYYARLAAREGRGS
jgi:hypothetical protein